MRIACLAVLLVTTGISEGCCPPPEFESRAFGRGLELSENGGDLYSVSPPSCAPSFLQKRSSLFFKNKLNTKIALIFHLFVCLFIFFL